MPNNQSTDKPTNQPIDIKLFKDFNVSDLIFKKIRSTDSGSRIIDIADKTFYQTKWLCISRDIEYSICLDLDPDTEKTFNEIDEKVIEHLSKVLDFSEQEIRDMYRPLVKYSNFRISILSGTVLFDQDKKFYYKADIKNVLKSGHWVRLIFNFKKIQFSNHEITFSLELIQIESR